MVRLNIVCIFFSTIVLTFYNWSFRKSLFIVQFCLTTPITFYIDWIISALTIPEIGFIYASVLVLAIEDNNPFEYEAALNKCVGLI